MLALIQSPQAAVGVLLLAQLQIKSWMGREERFVRVSGLCKLRSKYSFDARELGVTSILVSLDSPMAFTNPSCTICLRS